MIKSCAACGKEITEKINIAFLEDGVFHAQCLSDEWTALAEYYVKKENNVHGARKEIMQRYFKKGG